MRFAGAIGIVVGFTLATACSSDPAPMTWQVVAQHLPDALVSVWGSSATDVYLVGGDNGAGPAIQHYDGTAWTRLATQHTGNLRWVTGFVDGPVYMGGEGALALRYQGGAFTALTPPAASPPTAVIWGIWGSSPTDIWAVGGSADGSTGAFAWRLVGDAWVDQPLPADLAMQTVWKIYGRAADDAWLVGTNGHVLHWDGGAFTEVQVGGESLFTVSGDAVRYIAVGGGGTGLVYENSGSGWVDASPTGAAAAPPFLGVTCAPSGDYAVGVTGVVYQRTGAGWVEIATGFLDADGESLHAVWVDPSGGVWAVGGVLENTLRDGVVLHSGPPVGGGIQ